MNVDFVYLEACMQECAEDNVDRFMLKYITLPTIFLLWMSGSIYGLVYAIY